MKKTRRAFINSLGRGAAGVGLSLMLPEILHAAPLHASACPRGAWDGVVPSAGSAPKSDFTFEISLAEFSFASEMMSGKMTNLEFPTRAVNEFGINVLEYVSMFFNDRHTDQAYLRELREICEDVGAINHLIMVDGENIATLEATKRQQAVESYYPWLDAAKYLGCTSIRVNFGDAMAAISGQPEEGSADDVAEAALEGYSLLLERAAQMELNVLVENHFGYSTDAVWLSRIMKKTKSEYKGVLPDFGNFCSQRTIPETFDIAGIIKTKCVQEHNKYQGVRKLMPYAKGISAKTHVFGPDGNDLETDFYEMFKIIKASGWTDGYVGIEYEGGLIRDLGGESSYLSNSEGIRATKLLLEKVREVIK